MSAPNDFPNISHEQGPSDRPEIVLYGDNTSALRYRTPGTTIVLGPGSQQKHARDLWAGNRAIIRTKSGNSYGFGGDFVLDSRDDAAHPLPLEDIEVSIGEPCNIPEVPTTGDVEEVLLLYKIGVISNPDEAINGPSPFVELEQKLELASIMNQGPGDR